MKLKSLYADNPNSLQSRHCKSLDNVLIVQYVTEIGDFPTIQHTTQAIKLYVPSFYTNPRETDEENRCLQSPEKSASDVRWMEFNFLRICEN